MKTLLIILAFFNFPCMIDLSANCLKSESDTTTKLIKAKDNHGQIQTYIHNYSNYIDSNNCQSLPIIRELMSPERSPIYDSGNLINIQVPRGPGAALITKDNEFVCIRCPLSNTVEIRKIPTSELFKSYTIPSPYYMVLNNDGTKLIIASQTPNGFPPDPPPDDCSFIFVNPTWYSIFTIIDIGTQEISQVDTIINMSYIDKILKSTNNDVIYLCGNGQIVEFNIANNSIIRRWHPAFQIYDASIDNKNNKIFITIQDSLKVIDLDDGNIFSTPYYSNGDIAYAWNIFLDTLSNRVFVMGRQIPHHEVLVFDAISLNKLNPIDSTYLQCLLACPNLGSIYINGYDEGMTPTIELDYLTLNLKKILPTSLSYSWKTIALNDFNGRLYSFQIGMSENGMWSSSGESYLDIIEYDIETGNLFQYKTTYNKYSCSYGRTIAISSDGRYVVVTNSPENTVSILDLAPWKASTISGSSIVCQGQANVIYTVPEIINANSYIWTLPSGATGASTSNVISVNYGDSAFSGIISVKGHNNVGDGEESNLAITVNQKPTTPHIVLNDNILYSDAPLGNQWYVNNELIVKDTNASCIPFKNGNYHVIVKNNSCLSDPSNVITYPPIGIAETSTQNRIDLHPNPTFAIIEVSISTPFDSDYKIEIYNYLGDLIQTISKVKSETNFTIDLSKYPKGQYLLRIGTLKMMYQSKVIKM